MDRPRRQAVSPAEHIADYPSLSAHGEARRRFLRWLALSSAAAALGLELVGCPKTPPPSPPAPSGPPPTPPGTTDPTGPGQPAVEPQLTPEKIPWQDCEEVAGGMRAPMEPVAVSLSLAVGGGCVSVVFKDGREVTLVVAATLDASGDFEVPTAFAAREREHAALIRKVASLHTSAVLDDERALLSFEQALQKGLAAAVPSSIRIQSVSAAASRKLGESPRLKLQPARSPQGEPSQRKAARAKSESRGLEDSDASSEGLSPAAGMAPPTKPMVRRLWIPCRKPGCTTCRS